MAIKNKFFWEKVVEPFIDLWLRAGPFSMPLENKAKKVAFLLSEAEEKELVVVRQKTLKRLFKVLKQIDKELSIVHLHYEHTYRNSTAKEQKEKCETNGHSDLLAIHFN